MKIISACTLLALFQVARASFSMACSYIHTDAVDPIVFPGAISPHTHDFGASNRVTSRTTGRQLLRGPCTTCTVQGDKSAYWFPSIMYHFKNGTEIKLDPVSVGMYYLFNTSVTEVHPMPVNLRMVLGNAGATEPDKKARLGFTFLTAESVNLGFTASGFPDTMNNASSMAAILLFPACMKRLSLLDSADHISHMAYPDRFGQCPPEFPFRVPQIRLHPIFKFPEPVSWKKPEDIPLRLVTSPSRPNGFQWHGDVMSAWDQSILTELINVCGTTHPGDCRHEMKVKPIERMICAAWARQLTTTWS
jgi:hypothetical protein